MGRKAFRVSCGIISAGDDGRFFSKRGQFGVGFSPAILRKGVEEPFVPLVRGDVQHFTRSDQVRRGLLYRSRRGFHLREHNNNNE